MGAIAWMAGGLAAACDGSEESSGPTGSGLTGTAGSGASTGGSGATSVGGHSVGGGGSGSGAGQTGGMGGAGGSGPCGSVPTFADGASPTAEIHVATTGSDASGDGSAGSPFATIERAAQQLAPGSAIVVHAGTYAGGIYLSNLSGESTGPLWIGGAAGEARPIIEGGGTALQLSRVRYLVLHDLEVRSSTDNGINVDDGGDYGNQDATRFVVFRNLDIHDIGGTGNQDCLKLSGLDDYVVVDCSFARCGGGDSGSGIDHVGCHRGVIARSSFSEMSGNAIQSKGGSEDIEIRQNHIAEGGQRGVNMGGSTGFEYFRPPLSTSAPNAEARDIRVVSNVLVGGYSALAFVGCVDCLSANNTIIDPAHWVLRILQETTTSGGYEFLPCQNGRFVNNLVWFARADVATNVNVGANTDPTSFVFANNLWYAHDDPGQSAPTGLPVAESSSLVGQDPLLANPSGGDYSIGIGSPAAGAGQDLGADYPDYRGNCFHSPPSIGAFEVGG